MAETCSLGFLGQGTRTRRMMKCAKSQALTYGLRCTMPQQKRGTIKKNSESGLCQGKQWLHQQQRLCSCCSATFHSTELRQKCMPRILHSPEELNVVICGKSLYQGGVLYSYACGNPAETVQLMSLICIDSTNQEVSLSVYRQALFGSRKVCKK